METSNSPSTKFSFTLILFCILTFHISASTTIVNYDFNSGTTFATLAPSDIGGIATTFSSNLGFATNPIGTASGASSFEINTTSGKSLELTNSSGSNTNYFQLELSGVNLQNYASYRIYVQSHGSVGGATQLNVFYSTDGTSWTYFNRVNEFATISTSSWNEAIIDLGGVNELNFSGTLYFRLCAFGGTVANPIQIDNLQVSASYINPSTTGLKTLWRGGCLQCQSIA